MGVTRVARSGFGSARADRYNPGSRLYAASVNRRATTGFGLFELHTPAILNNQGIGPATFRTRAGLTLVSIGNLLGVFADRTGGRGCGVDHGEHMLDDIDLYFGHGHFVGYEYHGHFLTTTSDSAIGDTIARDRRLYGAAFKTSTAQGGSWSAAGLRGYLTAPERPDRHHRRRQRRLRRAQPVDNQDPRRAFGSTSTSCRRMDGGPRGGVGRAPVPTLISRGTPRWCSRVARHLRGSNTTTVANDPSRRRTCVNPGSIHMRSRWEGSSGAISSGGPVPNT